MFGKTSVSMMVLLVVVAASLIGISSIHQYIEGQIPTPTPRIQQSVQLEGRVVGTIISASKTCSAFIELLLPQECVF